MDLKRLSLEELAGVVNIYPWFALARKELCERMTGMGAWGESQFAETAMYMGDRRVLSALLRTVGEDCSDSNISEILEKCMNAQDPVQEPAAEPEMPSEAPAVAIRERRPRFAGADYFSKDEYEKVRRDGDSSLIDYTAPVSAETQRALSASQARELEICTETLARIYLEQGYPSEAKGIYSKLILAYPEKSAYFASLIDKIDELKN